MDKQIAVYDSTVSARIYLSYISEQAGGFACIGRDGKLYIRKIGENIAELPIKYFQKYNWGEKFKPSRVYYEDGVQIFEAGDTTNNTVYISQDNMYIVDQEQIDDIYNQLNGLEVYGFEGDSIIDPALDIGDLLIIDGKYVIYQGSSQYCGKWKANIASKIQCKAKEETTTRKVSEKTAIRRVQSQIDQVEGEITQLVEQSTELEQQVTEQKITIDEINSKISNIEIIATNPICKVEVLYALSTSETEAPTDGWSTTAPEWTDGKYMWQKTVTTYADGTTETSAITCISGSKGTDGKDGEQGDTGIGVSALVSEYYLSSSDTTQEGGEWSEQQQEWEEGKYFWTRTKITWTDGTITYTDPVLAKGINSANESASTAQQLIAEQKITLTDITNTVSETIIRLNNDYLTTEQVQGQIDTTNENLEIISQKQTELVQTSEALNFKITTIETDGVSKVKTSMGYTFDDEGFKLNRDGAETGTLIDEAAIRVIDKTGIDENDLLYAGYVKEDNENYSDYVGQTIVASSNMIVRNYLVVPNSRFEAYENPVLGGKGTGVFGV